MATQCVPRVSPLCNEGDVYLQDVCGGLALEEDCTGGQSCVAGACITPSPGDSCSDALLISATDQTIHGVFDVRLSQTETGSCAGAGPDRLYTFAIGEATEFTAVASGFDTTLYLRADCDDGASELACNDDVDYPSNLGSRISVSLNAGTYFLVLDAFEAVTGSYQLDLTFETVASMVDMGVASDMGVATDMGVASDLGATVDQAPGTPDAGVADQGLTGSDAAVVVDLGGGGRASGSSCSVSSPSPASRGAIWLFGLAGLALWRRRRTHIGG